MLTSDETIVAIATPLAESAIGVIKLSGKRAKDIAESIFTAQISQKTPILGWVIDKTSGIRFDNAIVLYLKGPKTQTGEDIVEISCHGGVAILKTVLGMVLGQGARLAERGEFSKRAFLNGKIDLIQAESIIELVKAKTKKSVIEAAKRAGGHLSGKINNMRNRLIHELAGIEAAIDFSDDIGDHNVQATLKTIESVCAEIDGLLQNAGQGIILNEGLKVALVGKPNTGKSSLLNAIMKHERAIVTDIPGTTTDTIEGWVNIKGLPVVLVDTAGIREPISKIESIGIQKTNQAISDAGIVLAIFDSSNELDNEDLEVIAALALIENKIAILNKADKPSKVDPCMIKGFKEVIKTSALQGTGIDDIEEEIVRMAGVTDEDSEMISNKRQEGKLLSARKALDLSKAAITEKMGPEVVAIDLKQSIIELGEITGHELSDTVIDKIFSEFCIGK